MSEQAEQNPFDVIWSDDLLKRRVEADYLLKFLVNRAQLRQRQRRSGGYVLNVDARWGKGKSFFLYRLHQHIAAQKYPSVYVDAWRDDFTNEPFTAVMSAIDQCVKPHLVTKDGKPSALAHAFANVKANVSQILKAAAIGMAKKGTGMLFGSGVDVIEGYIAGGENSTSTQLIGAAEEGTTEGLDKLIDKFAERQIEEFQKAKSSLEEFHTNLRIFLKQLETEKASELRLPFFVMVDELDRCRPTYAVEMLERIKHLFDVPGMVFVLGTNTKELAHSVQAVYGASFDGRHYLDRFFNRTYTLSDPMPTELVNYLWETHAIDELSICGPFSVSQIREVIVAFSMHFELTLRQLERIFEIFSALTVTWPDNDRKIDAVVLLAVISAYVVGRQLLPVHATVDGGWLMQMLQKAPYWPLPAYTNGPTVSVAGYIQAQLSFADTPMHQMIRWVNGGNVGLISIDRIVNEDATLKGVVEREVAKEFNALEQAGRPTQGPSIVADYWRLIEGAGRLA